MLQKLGKYELVGELGRGAMGVVYKAHDPTIGRLVALKTITTTVDTSQELLDRFYREARSAGTLQHANIVTIYEMGSEGDTPFIAMEFLEGESLEKIIDRTPVLSLLRKLNYIVPVCRALDYAHKRGVVHRDIKPANIMVTRDGSVKVVDFGIARISDSLKTRTDMLMGTLAYMSPQLIKGERADERSDIWAAGVTLYELLAYQRPFQGKDYAEVMVSIADPSVTPPPLQGVPPAVQGIVSRMLAKDAEARFQTMQDVLYQLEPIWKNIQESSAFDLVAESETAIRSQDLAKARELLREALRIDSRNEQAKKLLESVIAETKRGQTAREIQEHLGKARTFLNESRPDDAASEAEAALRMDSNFGPAQEMLEQARRLADRIASIRNNLKAAEQRFTEGALTEASGALWNVLNLDPENAQGLALQRRIEEERAKIELRKACAELLRQARQLWTDDQFDPSLRLLREGLGKFPGDAEISSQLQSFEKELAERNKTEQLAEARNLLASEKFDEALGVLQKLEVEFSGDSAVRSLRSMVLEERKRAERERAFQTRLAELNSLMDAGKFAQAIPLSEKMLREFPERTEVAGIQATARSREEEIQLKKELQTSLDTIRKKIEAEKFRDAASAAEKALLRFPANPDLTAALEEARRKQKEKDDQALLQKRIAEIQRSIKSGEHANAADLARQTLATLGPDERVTQLLNAAELELQEKRRKKEEQETRIVQAQTLLQEGKFDVATQILQEGMATKLFAKNDPRLKQVWQEIQEREAAAAARGPVPGLEPLPAEPGSQSGDYSHQESPVLEEPTGAPAETKIHTSSDSDFAATVMIGPEANRASRDFPALPDAADVRGQSATGTDSAPFVPISAGEAQPQEIAEPAARSSLTMPLAIGAVILIAAAAGWFYFSSSQHSKDEAALRDRAVQLQEEKRWPEALQQFEDLAKRGGDQQAFAQEHAKALKALLDEENSYMSEARANESGKNPSQAKQFLQKVVALHGDLESEAQSSLDRLGSVSQLAAGKLPPPVEEKKSKQPIEKKSAAGTPAPVAVEPPPAPAPASANACTLLASDIPIYLNRADSNRASGNYADAEREFNAVLACDPQNARALSGLARTKEGEKVLSQPGH